MSTEVNTEQIVHDLKNVARDAEDLIKATAGEISEKTRDARARLATALESAKESCERWEEKAMAGAKVTDQAIRKHPYEAIGLAFGLGVLLGVLATRK